VSAPVNETSLEAAANMPVPDAGSSDAPAVDRPALDVDIACVGFGPATGGFLHTLSERLAGPDGMPRLQSRVAEGMPIQVVCFERADDVAAGVSGVVTRARGLKASIPNLHEAGIPLATPVREEEVVYLLDPVGASRRSRPVRAIDRALRLGGRVVGLEHDAVRLPFIPESLSRDGGMVLSIGQFNQWVASEVMARGVAQVWPASPVQAPLFEGDRVAGIRLVDQGTDREGRPDAGYAPGMDVRAALTVVGDGPVGAVGQALDARFGLPPGHVHDDWALGMKMVVELRDEHVLPPGTVVHTLGYPEPEIFGFLYVCAPRVASLGIFVPSWFRSPVRTAYRHLQHWMLHPYLWRWLEGGTLRSWGAKSLQESGRGGEPHLAGDGYARIGEGSGSTNVLASSGVDEAWSTGVLLAEAVVELLEAGEPFTKANLERTYVKRRRESWVEREAQVAEHARAGFHRGVLRGLVGTMLTEWTGGRLGYRRRHGSGDAEATARANVRSGARSGARPDERPDEHDGASRPLSLAEFYRGRIPAAEIAAIEADCRARGVPLHDAVMERAGWPAIPLDGRLLVTHQDALLLGGKVQAAPGYADHVWVVDPVACQSCGARLCIEGCSGEALTPGPAGAPLFDRDKCVHCGACWWNCTTRPDASHRSNIVFGAGAGGLHSGEN